MLVACQAAATALETYLISKISLIGRIGIATVHREYRLLRSAPKTFALFFGIQIVIILVLTISFSRMQRRFAVTIAWLLLLGGCAGLLLTYLDFLHTYSHRLLKERFHLGFYLFWLGWIGSCLVFLISKNRNLPGERLSEDSPPQSGNHREVIG